MGKQDRLVELQQPLLPEGRGWQSPKRVLVLGAVDDPPPYLLQLMGRDLGHLPVSQRWRVPPVLEWDGERVQAPGVGPCLSCEEEGHFLCQKAET
jgi:hypothetical protein